MIAANNIQLVRIPIGASDRIYFPYSTSFFDKTVDKMVFAISGEINDITGTDNYVAPSDNTGSVFMTLYDIENNILCKDIDISLLSDSNYTDFIDLSKKINWDTSYVKITDSSLLNKNKTLLVYILYGGCRKVDSEFKNIRRVRFPANLTRQALSKHIVGYYGKLSRIELVSSKFPTDIFLTLNDKSGRGYDMINALLFGRKSIFDDTKLEVKIKNTLHVAYYDVDFENSYIWTGNQEIDIMFFFN